MKNQMLKLLSIEWNGKKAWECIRDGELTAALAFKGKLYDEMPIKIMYVGHAVNGWGELDASHCASIDDVADTILAQDSLSALNTLVNANGFHDNNKNSKPYYHINSKFICYNF